MDLGPRILLNAQELVDLADMLHMLKGYDLCFLKADVRMQMGDNGILWFSRTDRSHLTLLHF
jgi:hypothetical protein